MWRFYTIPAPGELGNDTWKGDSWKTGGGGTWLTGTYDPELDTVYWPIGNPAAMTDRSVRGDGDNLFTDSVVALDPDTGRRKWHYQFTPNDGHDWDSTEDMVLVDRVWRGQQRKLLMHADRNGHFYVLDRTTGTFLSGTPFIHQTWNKGFDEKGRPMPDSRLELEPGRELPRLSDRRRRHEFPVAVVQPDDRLVLPGILRSRRSVRQRTAGPGKGTRVPRARAAGGPPARGPNDPAPTAGIKAIDPETGKTVWDFKLFQGSLSNGVLATAGGVLFASARDGNIIALDARTGKDSLALSDRRQSCRGADQLCDRWTSVRGADCRERALQLYFAGVVAVGEPPT